MARYIVGLFPDTYSAEGAVADLAAAGFDEGQIRIMQPDQSRSVDLQQTGTDSEGGRVRFGDWLRAELARLGIGREESERHHKHILGGDTLVTVDAQGREEDARHLLQRAGATNMDQPAEAAEAAAAADTVRDTTGTWQLKPGVEDSDQPNLP